MNTQNSTGSTQGTASGGRDPVCRPDQDQHTENRLHKIGLKDQGDAIEDHRRDRSSSGTGHDDSLARRKGSDTDRLGIARGD